VKSLLHLFACLSEVLGPGLGPDGPVLVNITATRPRDTFGGTGYAVQLKRACSVAAYSD